MAVCWHLGSFDDTPTDFEGTGGYVLYPNCCRNVSMEKAIKGPRVNYGFKG